MTDQKNVQTACEDWSREYLGIVRSTLKVDLSDTPLYVNQNWANQFIYLSTHCHFMSNVDTGNWHTLEDAQTTGILQVFNLLIQHTFAILEQSGVSEIQAIKYIPDFFARHYDCLNYEVANRSDWQEINCDTELRRNWFATRPCDFLISNEELPVLDDAKHIWERGVEKANAGDSESALIDFKRAALINPENPYILNSLAQAYSESGQLQLAEEVFSKALLQEPDDIIILRNRGVNRVRLENFDDAIVDLNAAIQISPENDRQYYFRALAFYHLEDVEKALSDVNTAIQLNSESPRLYLLKGMCYDFLDEYSKAIDEFTTCISLDEKNEEAYHHRAWALLSEGNKNAAISDLDKLITLDPGRSEPYVRRAIARCDDEVNLSINDLDLIIQDSLNGWALHVGESDLSKFTLNEMELADYASLRKFGSPAFIEDALRKRAAKYIELGEFSSAINDFNIIEAASWLSLEDLMNRGKAKFSVGDREGACNDWEKVVNHRFSTMKSSEETVKECSILLAQNRISDNP